MPETDSGSEKNYGTKKRTDRKRKYASTYRAEWENTPGFAGWLQPCKKNATMAYCGACNKTINIASGRDALAKHAASKLHLAATKSIRAQPSISTFAVNSGVTSKIERKVKEGNQTFEEIFLFEC